MSSNNSPSLVGTAAAVAALRTMPLKTFRENMVPKLAMRFRGRSDESSASMVPYQELVVSTTTAHFVYDEQHQARRRLAYVQRRPSIDFRTIDGVVYGSGRITMPASSVADLVPPRRIGRLPALYEGVRTMDDRASARAVRDALCMFQAMEASSPPARAVDFPRVFFAYAPSRTPLLEDYDLRDEFDASRIEVDGMAAWPAAFFARTGRTAYRQHPLSGSPDPWASGDAPSDAAVYGDWFLDDGRPMPTVQVPDEVYFDLRANGGCDVRSPAWLVLRHMGVLDESQDYAAWIRQVCGRSEPAAQSVVDGDDDEPMATNAAERLLMRLAEYTADESWSREFRELLCSFFQGIVGHDMTREMRDAAMRSPWSGMVVNAPPVHVCSTWRTPDHDFANFVSDDGLLSIDTLDFGDLSPMFDRPVSSDSTFRRPAPGGARFFEAKPSAPPPAMTSGRRRRGRR